MSINKFTFIDLFCGIGGFHQAMTSLGGKCVFASDIDENCRKTYLNNYGIEPFSDITKINETDIPPHDVLCGGFPCQAFSKAGKRQGFTDPTKGTLFFDIIRIVKHHHPKYILLENVRNLASHDSGNTWKVINQQLQDAGYNLLDHPVIFSPHYIGIPQHRERVFIMCVRNDIGTLPDFYFDESKTKQCSIDSILLDDEEIPNLNKYQLSNDDVDLLNAWNEFAKGIKSPLPGFPVWSDRLCSLDTSENMDQYPRWKQNFIQRNGNLYEQNKEFIDKWLVNARKLPKFFGSKAKFEWQAGKTDNPNIWETILQYRPSGIRVKAGTYFPALVAITQTSIIGKRKRYLTPRECARLQSFPDTFRLDTNEAQAYKQLGNAVNVELVRLLALYLFGDKTTRIKYAKKESVNTKKKIN